MEFDAAKLDALIIETKWAVYWRERAECLEEWVCELLEKNQALRMALQKEQPQRRQHEEISSALSFLEIHQSPLLRIGQRPEQNLQPFLLTRAQSRVHARNVL